LPGASGGRGAIGLEAHRDRKGDMAMADGEGLLFVMMGIAPEYDEELNRWYDEEHLPERRNCDGFLSARRYDVVEGSPKYLAVYDLETTGVLESPPYRALTAEVSPWTKRIGGLLQALVRNVYVEHTPDSVKGMFATPQAVGDAAGLLAVLADVEPGCEEELRAWYDEEHLSERMKCPGFLQARRFEAVEGEPRFLALYDLEDLGVLDTAEYRSYRDAPTERTTQVLSHLRNSRRNVYRRIA
jgi:hypothetical protein